MSRRESIAMIAIGLVFVIGGIFLWAVVPGGAGVGITAILFFGAVAAGGVVELVRHRLRWSTEARILGAIATLMGLGLGAMGVVARHDPTAFRAPQVVVIAVGVIGVIFFGLGGLLLLVRGGRPFGRR